MAVPSGLQNLSSLNTFEDFKGYLSGTSPLASPVGQYGDTVSAGGGDQPTPASPATPPTPATSQLPGRIFDPTAGSSASGLLNPFHSSLTATSDEIRGLGEKFRTEMGPAPQFDQGAMEKALGASATQEQISGAKSAATQTYQGPTGLDPEGAAKANLAAKTLTEQAGAFQSGAGIQGLLSMGVPSLTPGEAKYETGQVLGSQDFRSQARDAASRAELLRQSMTQQEELAPKLAEERKAQTDTVRETTRDFFGGRRQDVLGAIDTRVSEEEARGQKLARDFDAFSEEGDWEKVLEFDPELYAQIRSNPTEQARQSADRMWNSIMRRYPDLSEQDVLDLTIGKKGLEKYTSEGEMLKNQKTDPLVERQKALEQYFSAGTHRNKEAGPLAAAKPLYGFGTGEQAGETLARTDLRQFVELDLGIAPDRSNLSTEDERRVFNRVGEILDEADRLEAAGEPFRAAQVAADLDGFLEAEEKALTERGEKVSEGAKKWRKTVTKARQKYKSAKRRARWGKIALVGAPLWAKPMAKELM